jgi:pimeloyl-ACP methyl ester carboxylesterase
MSTYVLVPGGWRGGWYFQSFAEALCARGHRVYPVTLTGLGERRHLLHASTNLDTHIDDVLRVLEMERLSDVVLLGHSYAGMVLSGVVDRAGDRIAAAIYSDAYVPDNGQSCFELTSESFRRLFLEGAAQDGFSVPPPPGADPRATPHPLAAFLQRVHLAQAQPSIRRGYVYLSGWQDSPFTSVYDRVRQDAAWQTFSLPVGHNVLAEAFDELLEIALQFA